MKSNKLDKSTSEYALVVKLVDTKDLKAVGLTLWWVSSSLW